MIRTEIDLKGDPSDKSPPNRSRSSSLSHFPSIVSSVGSLQGTRRSSKWCRILFLFNFASLFSVCNVTSAIAHHFMGGRFSKESLFILFLSIFLSSVSGLVLAPFVDSWIGNFYLGLFRSIALFFVYLATLYCYGYHVLLQQCYFSAYFFNGIVLGATSFFAMERSGSSENKERNYVNAVLLSLTLISPFGFDLSNYGMSYDDIMYIGLFECVFSFCGWVLTEIMLGSKEKKDILVFEVLARLCHVRSSNFSSGRVNTAIKQCGKIVISSLPLMFMWVIQLYLQIVWWRQAQHLNYVPFSPKSLYRVRFIETFAIPIISFIVRPLLGLCNLLKNHIHCLSIGYFLSGLSILITAVLYLPYERSFNQPINAGYGNIIYFNLMNKTCYLESSRSGIFEIPAGKFVPKVDVAVDGVGEDVVRILDHENPVPSNIIFIESSSIVSYFITENGIFRIRDFDPKVNTSCIQGSTVYLINVIENPETLKNPLYLIFENDYYGAKAFQIFKSVPVVVFTIEEDIWKVHLTLGETSNEPYEFRGCATYAFFVDDGPKILPFVLSEKYGSPFLILPQLILWVIGSSLVYPSIFAMGFHWTPPTMRATMASLIYFIVGLGSLVGGILLNVLSHRLFRVDYMLYVMSVHFLIFLVFLNFVVRKKLKY